MKGNDAGTTTAGARETETKARAERAANSFWRWMITASRAVSESQAPHARSFQVSHKPSQARRICSIATVDPFDSRSIGRSIESPTHEINVGGACSLLGHADHPHVSFEGRHLSTLNSQLGRLIKSPQTALGTCNFEWIPLRFGIAPNCGGIRRAAGKFWRDSGQTHAQCVPYAHRSPASRPAADLAGKAS
jgi:hypothetical protein